MTGNKFLSFSMFFGLLLFTSCKDVPKNNAGLISLQSKVNARTVKSRNVSQQFKDYWYAGAAEITSYELKQARYGEIREGTAVNIFVTEDFLPEIQVKANYSSDENIPVLKLNQVKNFLTGIYPYSIMTSTFNPVNATGHALKVSNSVQEWCGHVYTQLNNKKDFEIESHSYFEGEADRKIKLPKTWLENELWNLIRINPDELPTGETELIPSLEYLRLAHKELMSYRAILNLKQNESVSVYNIHYPELKRDLTIHFENKFPYAIEKWEDTYVSGFGPEAEALTTTATKIKRIKTAYWSLNKNKDVILRDTLGLK